MERRKNIIILGSTGSIGNSALEVIENNLDKFRIKYLSANTSIDQLLEQAQKFHPEGIIITDNEAYNELKSSNLPFKVFSKDDLLKIIVENDIDIVIAAMVGFAGLESTLEAAKSGKKIALANKETLVVAGHIITKICAESGAEIIPIDSEHSAILQCLIGENRSQIKKIILTASGGPFLYRSIDDFENITIEEALNHPNWKMGNKITIDSATMMNKGLEVIEAHWLFGLKREQIEVIIHPQSIIHSMVEFVDGSIKAQLGIPDMKLPIQYALSYPERFPVSYSIMDFVKYSQLTFLEPDLKKFKCLELAYKSLELGGSYPVVLNAANEVAVQKFLNGDIKFVQIPEIIENTLSKFGSSQEPEIEEIFELDAKVREYLKN
ncbi:MAG: 1-deoxy-D-xylulose-5-phosphate reductoisomerase [Ignavibacterium sp.]|nr:1-deoxy-D-xylulose-5-phosphate reductoisomerase [Ignavibacterium sp.]